MVISHWVVNVVTIRKGKVLRISKELKISVQIIGVVDGKREGMVSYTTI